MLYQVENVIIPDKSELDSASFHVCETFKSQHLQDLESELPSTKRSSYYYVQGCVQWYTFLYIYIIIMLLWYVNPYIGITSVHLRMSSLAQN